MSERHRRPVVLSDALAEGASSQALLRLLDGSVACTHGDMLEKLTAVVGTQDERGEQISFVKGGVWALSLHGDEVSIVAQTRRTADDRRVMTMAFAVVALSAVNMGFVMRRERPVPWSAPLFPYMGWIMLGWGLTSTAFSPSGRSHAG